MIFNYGRKYSTPWRLVVLVWLSGFGYCGRPLSNPLDAEVTPLSAEVNADKARKGKINPAGPQEPPIWLEEACY